MPIRILIAGARSFIGTSVERGLRQSADRYLVETLDLRADNWRAHDFSGCDSVLHVAGIAHVSSDPRMAQAYMRVNRDLAVEVARLARDGGARQFIFLSSMSVYGPGAAVGRPGRISPDAPFCPENAYGQSKLEAEQRILALERDDFRVVILRLPMVYGPGCKGNYNALVKFARRLPVFPALKNERGAIYIDNLTEFIRLAAENRERGVFYPQNREIVSTGDFVREIAAAHGRRVRLVRAFNPLLRLLGGVPLLRRAFGSRAYAPEMTGYAQEYCLTDFHTSIIETEKGGD